MKAFIPRHFPAALDSSPNQAPKVIDSSKNTPKKRQAEEQDLLTPNNKRRKHDHSANQTPTDASSTISHYNHKRSAEDLLDMPDSKRQKSLEPSSGQVFGATPSSIERPKKNMKRSAGDDQLMSDSKRRKEVEAAATSSLSHKASNDRKRLAGEHSVMPDSKRRKENKSSFEMKQALKPSMMPFAFIEQYISSQVSSRGSEKASFSSTSSSFKAEAKQLAMENKDRTAASAEVHKPASSNLADTDSVSTSAAKESPCSSAEAEKSASLTTIDSSAKTSETMPAPLTPTEGSQHASSDPLASTEVNTDPQSHDYAFGRFAELAIEIRLMIWKHALLEPRKIKLHRDEKEVHPDNKLVPVGLHVNHEAREVARKHYIIMSDHMRHGCYNHRRFVRCIDPTRDTITMNIVPLYFTTSSELAGKLIQFAKTGPLSEIEHITIEMASSVMTKEFRRKMTQDRGKWNPLELFHGLKTVDIVGVPKKYTCKVLDMDGEEVGDGVGPVRRSLRTVSEQDRAALLQRFVEFFEVLQARHEGYSVPELEFKQTDEPVALADFMVLQEYLL